MQVGDFSKLRQFKPGGPVSAAFIGDKASKVKALLGPVGGGKSVACVFDSIRRPSYMPACNDGIVRYRRAIVGTTYGQLERNLYPTWLRWLPEDGGEFTPEATWEGGGGRSATHRLEWTVVRREPDGEWRERTVLAEYVFAAIGEASVEQFMRGFEPTDFWGYELDQLPEAVIDVGIGRLGRYPATGDEPDALTKGHGFVYQFVGDLNAPDQDHWFVDKFDVNPSPGFKVYRQPSGMSPQAENLHHLPDGYYEGQIAALERKRNGRNLIKRMVHAQYAPSADGEPVYPEYDDSIHLAPAPLVPMKDLPLQLCFDQGLQRPACLGYQTTPKGQRRVLFECVPGRMNARRFAHEVRNTIQEVCPGIRLAELHYCDPAGMTGADKEAGDMAWAEIVSAELGIVIQGTETNEIDPRLTAVKDELSYIIEPGVPAFLLSPSCKMTRAGFIGRYRYKRQKVGNTERTSDLPEKNDWSNPHDALQYGFLGEKGRYGVIQGRRDPRAPARALGHKSRGRDAVDDSCVSLPAPVEI